jgi:lysozyme
MTVSIRGLLEIAEHEGIVPAPYLDSVGVWTWGIGHTAAAGGPDPAQMTRAMPQDIDAAVIIAIDQFAIDVKGYVARVKDAIRVPLAQHQFDALVSFDFNTGGIHRAKLTAAINAGDPDAARHFMGWLWPPEIRKRRTAEMALFRTGDYAANGDAIPIWRTDGTCSHAYAYAGRS